MRVGCGGASAGCSPVNTFVRSYWLKFAVTATPVPHPAGVNQAERNWFQQYPRRCQCLHHQRPFPL